MSPLLRTVLLWVGFLAIVVVGVFTVLLPELEDEPDEGAAGGADAGVAAAPADDG